MLLTKLQPSNFGPFAREQSLVLDREVTVLTGPNDVGKSSILRLIAKMFRDPVAGPLVEADVNTDYLHKVHGLWKADRGIRCGVEFAYSDNSPHYINLDYPRRPGIVFQGVAYLAPEQSAVHITTIGDGTSATNVVFPLSRFPRTILLPREPDTVIRDVINLASPSASEKELLSIAFSPNFDSKAYAQMTPVSVDRALRRAEHKLNQAIEKLFPRSPFRFGLSDYQGNKREISITLVDGHQGFVPPSLRGAGVRRLLSVMGLLVGRLNEGEQTIILYDEPEQSLHADAQHCLRALLEGVAKSPYVQVVYSTHSPSMINTLRPRSIRLLTRASVDEVACSIIDNAPADSDYATVRASLGVTPADSLLYAPVTIVVEGRTEVACLVPMLLKLEEARVEGFLEVSDVLAHCHILDGQGDTFPLLCRVARSQGAEPVVFVDGDKRRRVEQLQAAGKLKGVTVEALPAGMEFEDLLSKESYFEGLASMLERPPMALQHAFEEHVKARELPAQMMFSKRVASWMLEAFPDYEYDKARAMMAALDRAKSTDVHIAPLASLMRQLKKALAVVQQSGRMGSTTAGGTE